MNILVVGGTGMVGGNAALFLKQAGQRSLSCRVIDLRLRP